MKIKKLKISNILSIEEASVEFGESGLVLVEGFDYDTGRANGAGKSAIFNALSFALYDKVPRKITKSEIMRKGAKQASAEVTVSTSSGEYTVRRCRPVSCTYSKDGVALDITQEEFETTIGLNYDQFLTTIYNAQDSQDRFVSLNDRGKKEFLLKIMNLGNFNLYKKNITDEVTKIVTETNILKTKIDGYKNSINIYKQQIVDPETINKQIVQLDLDIFNYTSEIKKLEAVSAPDLSKYSKVDEQINDKLLNIRSVRMLCDQKRLELKKLQNMSPDDQCPDCNADLNIVNGHVHKAGDQSVIDEQIKVVVTQINQYEDDIAKEAEIKALQLKIANKKKDELKDYNTALSSISEHKNSIKFKTKEKETLSAQILKNDSIKESASKIIKDASTANERIKEITEEKEVLETVALFFDPTGAPAYIMDNVVDAFNDSVTDYINHIWPNATYSLQTYKENKDKSITSKFSEVLMINGKPTSIGSLSGGELRALSLAIDFAVVDILSGKFSVDLNPIILDEPFNGLDTPGKEMVIELLEKLANDKEIWVVDHASEAKSLFTRTVRVEKRNGSSKIMDQ